VEGTGEAERLGGLEVDDELELGGLLDGKFVRLRAMQDAIGTIIVLNYHSSPKELNAGPQGRCYNCKSVPDGPDRTRRYVMSSHKSKGRPEKKKTKISSHADLTKTTERGAIELQEEELKGVTGGRDGSLEAGVHFKYDLKGQKEG
jgi:hypothetical protein